VAPTQPAPPYPVYATLVGLFGAGMAGIGAVASLLGRRPERLTALDLAVMSAATFKVSRTVAHDEVLSFVRRPFVQETAHEGDEEPLQTGDTRQAIGELLTCSRCIGMWAGAAVVALHTVSPRTGRLLTWSFAVSAANDVLQAGFAALTSKANELEQRSSAG
jgi:uncharacterized protein DUF1360